jgi:hypothetical protein
MNAIMTRLIISLAFISINVFSSMDRPTIRQRRRFLNIQAATTSTTLPLNNHMDHWESIPQPLTHHSFSMSIKYTLGSPLASAVMFAVNASTPLVIDAHFMASSMASATINETNTTTTVDANANADVDAGSSDAMEQKKLVGITSNFGDATSTATTATTNGATQNVQGTSTLSVSVMAVAATVLVVAAAAMMTYSRQKLRRRHGDSFNTSVMVMEASTKQNHAKSSAMDSAAYA